MNKKLKNNLLNLSIKDLFKNKLNLLIIAILIILGCIFLVGTSYYSGILTYWRDAQDRYYNFNMANILPYEDVDRKKLIELLKQNEHVVDVFQADEYMGYAYFTDYISDDLNGAVALVGTIPGTKKIIYGSDIDPNENEEGMICPNNFIPDSLIYSGNYHIDKIIDLTDKIGTYINIKYADRGVEKLKLIGVFDGKYDYSDPNRCHVTHATIKRLKNTYEPLFIAENYGMKVLLDDIKNADTLNNYEEYFHSYKIETHLKTEIGDKVLNFIKYSCSVLAIASFILIYLVFSRHIVNSYKNIGVLKVSGYSNRQIKGIYYIEAFAISIISSFVSIIISLIISKNFPRWFLARNVQLSLITTNLNILSILLTSSIIILTVLIAVTLALHKIKKLDINEIIYE